MTNKKTSALSVDPSMLCALLEKKVDLFKNFMSATESLKDMIEQRHAEAIEMMIDRRHDYMVLIDIVDKEIRRIRTATPPSEVQLVPETRKRIQSLTKALENMISKTMSLNRECEVAAEDELGKVRNDLSGLSRTKKGFTSYAGISGTSYFLDVKI